MVGVSRRVDPPPGAVHTLGRSGGCEHEEIAVTVAFYGFQAVPDVRVVNTERAGTDGTRSGPNH